MNRMNLCGAAVSAIEAAARTAAAYPGAARMAEAYPGAAWTGAWFKAEEHPSNSAVQTVEYNSTVQTV